MPWGAKCATWVRVAICSPPPPLRCSYDLSFNLVEGSTEGFLPYRHFFTLNVSQTCVDYDWPERADRTSPTAVPLARNNDTLRTYAGCLLLDELFFRQNGQDWANSEGWMTNPDHCQWYGVECGDGRLVSAVRLSSNYLSGDYPNGFSRMLNAPVAFSLLRCVPACSWAPPFTRLACVAVSVVAVQAQLC